MIEVARTQDEETGDGTKSVIILGKDVLALQHLKYLNLSLNLNNLLEILKSRSY